ncbi:MAG: putative glycoside hydrolase [Fusobacterium sp.]|uniref:putative glycoside hydrolase n=1 Tax=Fusobacterium sp. TaxID=68766 RepID=UPI003F9F2C82
MRFTKKILLFITIVFVVIFQSKETYSKEKKFKVRYGYAKEKVSIYSDENKKENIGSLIKGTRVNVFDTKEVIKKSKDKNGKEIEQKTVMKKITYKDLDKTKLAWIEDTYLVPTLNEAVDEKFKNLDFSEKTKKEYKDNKRVKVRGLYVSAHSVALKGRLDELIELAKKNNINAFVIDIKGDYGELTFPMSDEINKYTKSANKNPIIKEIEPVIKKLKDNGIYTIARIVSFKDTIYAKENPDKIIVYKDGGKAFTNSDGLVWVSAYDKNLWEYNVTVAKEAAKVGFNEIQFDYVRFPASNGGKLDKVLNYRNTDNMTKAEAIQKYLNYAKKELSPYNVYISADIYGQVGSSSDDMSLGQFWEAVSSEVDYVSPMMYPSHYGKGVYGLAVPDANPYKTIYHSTKDSINRNNNISSPAIIRPWIQAFTATWVKGHINYGPNEVKEQIKAMKDLGVDEYILWSATNRYENFF